MIFPELLVPVAAKREQPRELVARHVLRPQHLGEASFSVASPHLELPHPILCNDKSLREEEVVGRLCVDVRNAPRIPQDFDRLRKPAEHDRAGVLGESGFRLRGEVGLRRRLCARSDDRGRRREDGGGDRGGSEYGFTRWDSNHRYYLLEHLAE